MESPEDELELEPIDPEILAHERRRSVERSRAAEDAIDINAAFDEAETDDPINLQDLARFRFTTRHLLQATAVLAIVMTLFLRLGPTLGLAISVAVTLGAAWWFVLRSQRRKLEALRTRREQMAAEVARRRAREDGLPVEPVDPKTFAEVNSTWDAAEAQQPAIDFSFSLKHLLIAFAVAALILTFSRLVAGPQLTALLLGVVALGGLLVQWGGLELPPFALLGWWLLLVLYLLVGAWGAMDAP